jgi:hypothetical protein
LLARGGVGESLRAGKGRRWIEGEGKEWKKGRAVGRWREEERNKWGMKTGWGGGGVE